jgi:hypothetical protein
MSQPTWDEAPDWQKKSAISGVVGVIFRSEGPAEAHANWLSDKTAAGWKHGLKKDIEKKEHPNMVPYEKLPLKEQQKDVLFVTTVTAMVSSLRTVQKKGMT